MLPWTEAKDGAAAEEKCFSSGPQKYPTLGTTSRGYRHTAEYYLAIKKSEIMPFAATWMDLEMIILSEVSQTKTNI